MEGPPGGQIQPAEPVLDTKREKSEFVVGPVWAFGAPKMVGGRSGAL